MIEQWTALASRITCDGPVQALRFAFVAATPDNAHHGDFGAVVTFRAPDSDSEAWWAHERFNISFWLDDAGPPTVAALYAMAWWVYQHELQECFRVDGGQWRAAELDVAHRSPREGRPRRLVRVGDDFYIVYGTRDDALTFMAPRVA